MGQIVFGDYDVPEEPEAERPLDAALGSWDASSVFASRISRGSCASSCWGEVASIPGLCNVWMGPDSSCTSPALRLNPRVCSVPAVLVCVVDGRWCPVVPVQAARRTCCRRACALEPTEDLIEHMLVELQHLSLNLVSDAAVVTIRCPGLEECLTLKRGMLSVRQVRLGLARSADRFLLLPTAAGGGTFFHIATYDAESRGPSRFVCLDASRGRLLASDVAAIGSTAALDDDGARQPGVFALQEVRCAQLSLEARDLRSQCAEQGQRLRELNEEVLAWRRSSRSSSADALVVPGSRRGDEGTCGNGEIAIADTSHAGPAESLQASNALRANSCCEDGIGAAAAGVDACAKSPLLEARDAAGERYLFLKDRLDFIAEQLRLAAPSESSQIVLQDHRRIL
eukprot:TRINITY_DN48248_c0_g1_i2.p1 TRINITY_DN48248_c0_g1~~TRINITY_DN48248_c0_g1_i2.p1  ORF type:complete len:398 (+),score=71.06 TRINITY_DN48248_c0_g1_i2:32-1225(+)